MPPPATPFSAAALRDTCEALELAGLPAQADQLRQLLAAHAANQAFIDQVAALQIWNWDQDDGAPYQEGEEPDDGADDSHACLMGLIEQARTLNQVPQAPTLQTLFPGVYDALAALRALNRQAADDEGYDWDTLQPALNAVDNAFDQADTFPAAILGQLKQQGADLQELDDWVVDACVERALREDTGDETAPVDDAGDLVVAGEADASVINNEGPLAQIVFLRGQYDSQASFLEALKDRFSLQSQPDEPRGRPRG